MAGQMMLNDPMGMAMASSSKKGSTTGVPAKATKPKKNPKTYVFQLELGESNEHVYPEFSWAELVRKETAKEVAEKAKIAEKKGSAGPVKPLDPYASDDEDDLKAMAERFEKKYGNVGASGIKKKRRAEDFIDRGAGYDESDSFIDNTDAYDEIVPQELQTVHGGFYINSGQLDFKEVEVSDDDDAEDSVNKKLKNSSKGGQPVKKGPKIKFGTGHPSTKKRKVSTDSPAGATTPQGVASSSTVVKKNIGDVKMISGINVNKIKKKNSASHPTVDLKSGEGVKKARPLAKSSSSSSSTSSSSESTSSDSESTSSTEEEDKDKGLSSAPKLKVQPKVAVGSSKSIEPPKLKQVVSTINKQIPKDGGISVKQPSNTNTPPPLRKLKTKNVPPKTPVNASLVSSPKIMSANSASSNNSPRSIANVTPSSSTNNVPSSKLLSHSGNDDVIILSTSIASPSTRTSAGPALIGSSKTSSANVSRITSSYKPIPTPKSSPGSAISISSSQGSDVSERMQSQPQKQTPAKIQNSTKQKSFSYLQSPELMAQEILSKISLANIPPVTSSAFNTTKMSTAAPKFKKSGPASAATITTSSLTTTKPLPKLQHKSGLTIEKNKNAAANRNSSSGMNTSLSGVPKANPISLPNPAVSTAAFNSLAYHLAATASMSAYLPFTNSHMLGGGGTNEATKVKNSKTLPGIGSSITVTEVKDKSGGTSSSSGLPTANINTSSLLGMTSSLFPSHTSSLNLIPSSSSFSTSQASSSSPKVSNAAAITITPKLANSTTPSANMGGGESMSLGSLMGNSTLHNNKLPGYFTPFDVNALLGNSNKPVIDLTGSRPSSKVERSQNANKK